MLSNMFVEPNPKIHNLIQASLIEALGRLTVSGVGFSVQGVGYGMWGLAFNV